MNEEMNSLPRKGEGGERGRLVIGFGMRRRHECVNVCQFVPWTPPAKSTTIEKDFPYSDSEQ